LPSDWDGIDGQIAAAFNQALSHEDQLSREVMRLARTVGRDGRLKERMSVPGTTGGWAAKIHEFNTLLDDLARPTTEIARTIGAVAKGDLGQSMELEVDGRPLRGEFLRSAKLVNSMIEQLAVFTSEVTRVAREVGTEGKLGGQARVKGTSGVWKDLTESVNQMAGNLTAQVRNIADVTIAVASGDLSKKITVDVRGEILQLKEAINTMVDQLRSFASEVTRVAREVGTDGRLGGQAVVPGVAGTWKDLTDSVNAMATNLTAQVRNIAQVTIILSQQLAENPAGLSDRQIEFCRVINSSGADLLNLINDILDLSKIESGTVTPEIERIPFARIRDSMNRTFRHLAEAKNFPFNVDFAQRLPQSIESDPQRLEQILKNLVSNAIKFTSQGHVEVRVDLATEGWSPDHPVLGKARQVVAFSVEDTGIGIAPEKQRMIFDAFQQADAGTSRKYGGTGLGLAISRELTSLLGGEIKLTSTPRQGSTFTLYLPLGYLGAEGRRTQRLDSPPSAPTRADDVKVSIDLEAAADLRDCKGLVVDDDARNIFALTALLENYGMEVLAATNGRTAIEIVAATPDLSMVIIDLMMPDMDGYETIQAVRNDPRFLTLPILALTAKAMEADREKCLKAGASDYISKPVNTDQLLSLMRRRLTR
jgi:signal transduction histidine kinase/CheY-like chemotaxis protein